MPTKLSRRETSPNHSSSPSWETLGDFTTTLRVLPISGLAILIGAVCAFVALALLRLIGLFTNLFYYGRWSSAMVSPVGNHLGWFSVLIPVAGALIIGVMQSSGATPFAIIFCGSREFLMRRAAREVFRTELKQRIWR